MQPVICTVAPPAASVETRFAVLASTWSAMPIVMPANGFSFSNCFFMAASTGMYCAAHSIFSFPEFMNILIGGRAEAPPGY